MVNLDWAVSNGQPTGEIKYSVSAFDPSGNLIIAGNTFTTSQNENFLVTKINSEGTTLWQYEYNFDDLSDYATGLATDLSGNIYVTGASQSVSDSSFDYATLKLNSSGTEQWTARYVAPGGGDDVPVSLKMDTDDNVYITGTSKGSASDADYATVKYDKNGNHIWTSRYDYVSLPDAAVGLELDEVNDKVIVTGASASTAIDYDYASVKYEMDDGTQVSVSRQVTGVNGYNSPVSIVKDDWGNLYITGNAITQSGVLTTDIQTIKLDTSFAVKWIQKYDHGSTLDDVAADLKVDGDGNVYIGGAVQNSSLGFDFITIKYDSTGAIQWKNILDPDDPQDTAKVQYLSIDGEGNIYATGSWPDGPFKTIAYDSDGSTLWQLTYEDPNNEEGIPTDLRIDLFGAIYVTGKVDGTSGSHYVTLKYEKFSMETEYRWSANGEPTHVKNHMFVRFTTNVVDTSFVDNIDLTFGDVSDVITDQDLISDMDDALGAGGNLENWTMLKAYKGWPTTRTTSVTRLGRTIQLPTLWTTFVLVLEETAPETQLDEIALSDSLTALNSPYIAYAHPNHVAKLLNIPNDPSYQNNDQASLWFDSGNPTVFTDADINIQPAWALLHNYIPREPKGKKEVKVGVFDSGIHHHHQDLGGGGNFGGLSGSIVDISYDYLTGMPTSIPASDLNPDVQGHGTLVSGIIGALRNNNTGVAGIAGGDIAVDNKEGVHQIGMRIIKSDRTTTALIAIDAINDATDPNSAVAGIDIINNSWRFTESELNALDRPGFWDGVHLAFKSDIILVNGRGNDGTDDHSYPATFPDDWGISVGASGVDGEWHDNENAPVGSPDRYTSNYGKEMDLIAPGISAMIYTTDKSSTSSYATMNGSSAATAHVAGVAGLLLGYSDTPLAVEDVEHIVEYGAVDKGTLNYDQFSGHGLLDAGASLQLIEKPFRKILHLEGDPAQVTIIQTITNKNVLLTEPYTEGTRVFPKGTYTLDIEEVKVVIPYTLAGNTVIPNIGAGKDPFWVRNSASNLWGPPEGLFDPPPTAFKPLTPNEGVSFLINPQNGTATLKGYRYRIVDQSGAGNHIDFPNSAWTNPTMAFSLLIHDPDAVIGFEGNDIFASPVKVFPNPAQNQVRIQYSLLQPATCNILINDIHGRTIQTLSWPKQESGIHRQTLDIHNLSPGIYIVQIQAGNSSSFQKLIKQ